MVRIKHRYLLLNILYPIQDFSRPGTVPLDRLKFYGPTPRHINQQVFLNHLKSHISAAFGDHGAGVSQSSLKVVYFSPATSTAIVRVPRAHYQIVWAALSYMTEMPALPGKQGPGVRCVVRVVRVSGTIRKAEEELLRRSRESVVAAKVAERLPPSAVPAGTAPSRESTIIPPGIDSVLDYGSIEDSGASASE